MNQYSLPITFRKTSLLLLLFLAGCASPEHYVEYTIPPFTIVGTAIDRDSGEPIANLNIWATVEEEDWIGPVRKKYLTKQVTTDSQGRYKLEIPETKYKAFRSLGSHVYIPTYKAGYMETWGSIRNRAGDIRPHETRVFNFNLQKDERK